MNAEIATVILAVIGSGVLGYIFGKFHVDHNILKHNTALQDEIGRMFDMLDKQDERLKDSDEKVIELTEELEISRHYTDTLESQLENTEVF